MAINVTLDPHGTSFIHHAERQYHSRCESQYILPSDAREKERLELQHKMLKRSFGDRILMAPVKLGSGDRVLDCGTGSGIWALDLAETLAESGIRDINIQGIDIEPRLFPAPEARDALRASGITTIFEVGSATNLPQEWTETFRLIHQRLLVAAFQLPDWKTVFAEFYRVAAPGGWVQLLEVGPYSSGPVSDSHWAMVQSLFEKRGLMTDCARHIPGILEEAGFVDVKVERRTIPLGAWAGEDGVQGQNNLISVFRGMKTPILKAGGLGHVSSEGEFDELLDNVEKEWDEHRGSSVEFVTFYGQKPE